MKILFVCTGNTCRSPMAQYYLSKIIREKGLDMEADSAGVSPVEDENIYGPIIDFLKSFGIDAGGHKPKELTGGLVDESDLIIAMEEHHKQYILMNYPQVKDKVFLITEYAGDDKSGIGDPFGGSEFAYRSTFEKIKYAVDSIIKKLNTDSHG